MARNETYVDVPPDAVWRMLCDPYSYPQWVVGTDRTVEADPDWPAPDSAFKVRFPLGLKDLTHARIVEPEKRIVLDTGGGPWGAARADIRLEARNGGTHVTMIENPAGFTAPLRYFPPAQWALKVRNAEAMRRFREVARRYASTSSA
jgi:uncharacterized protein YndB with AHSA1/START domain